MQRYSKFQNFFNKRFWRKGNGEILGFVYVLPFIIFLVMCIISSAQVALLNQSLSNAAYNCGRAAVVSESETLAVERANEIYSQLVGEPDGADGYIACEIEVLGGDWEKGQYIRCTVRKHIDVLMPFTSGVRSQSIVMMIEGGDID